jgi:hypothetical protein
MAGWGYLNSPITISILATIKDRVTNLRIVVYDRGLRWLRLFEQDFRVDKWSLCRG